MKPRAKHCLLCGGRLRTVRLEDRRRPRCPRCGWIFYDNPIPATGAIIERGDHILLARRGAPPYAGTWDLPGGFLEAGEHPDQGLRRELAEELGARATAMRFVGFFTDTYGRGGFPLLALVYRVRLRGEPRAASDVAEVRWFPRDRLPIRQVGFPSLRRALTEHVRRRGRRGGMLDA
ncbi:MAG TPA: NUDIX domain-containing protein [Candidatus Limnocylindrales bacterium]|nr:NUDIX domain-containing protein [Candidatus Limnocylindrales bacterium]